MRLTEIWYWLKANINSNLISIIVFFQDDNLSYKVCIASPTVYQLIWLVKHMFSMDIKSKKLMMALLLHLRRIFENDLIRNHCFLWAKISYNKLSFRTDSKMFWSKPYAWKYWSTLVKHSIFTWFWESLHIYSQEKIFWYWFFIYVLFGAGSAFRNFQFPKEFYDTFRLLLFPGK